MAVGDVVASFTETAAAYGLPASTQTLAQRAPPSLDITELQTLLDTFAAIYNTERPHRATPQTAYLARPEAHPAAAVEHFRIRHRLQQNPPPTHCQPPHLPRPQLLAQPTEKPRPMAEEICNR
ncbi:hypothetical protein ACGFK1_01015 [Mycobacterium sp. NPDC048908]|uniref:hypothetical protein n=1 Tax=Mycobacterium sp. NPDC048908 TaxID=3364292 RepID=UPI00372122E2